MLHRAQACGCEQDIGMSKSREPHTCDHGNRLEYVKALGRPEGSTKPRKPLKQGKGFAASKMQREKVRFMPCLGCGADEGVDPAHVWSRGKGGCDHPDCVIPLCRSCHRAFDEGTLDLLPRLADSEAWQDEQAHPILRHGVSPVELVRRLSGGTYEFVKREPLPEVSV
jgi:hypothetical protein